MTPSASVFPSCIATLRTATATPRRSDRCPGVRIEQIGSLPKAPAIADAADALSAVEKHNANLALLDVCTENDSSGIVAAAAIKQAHPDVRVVIMTGMPEITFVE